MFVVVNMNRLIRKIPISLFQNYIYSFVTVLSGVVGLSALTAKNGIEYIGSISVYLTAQAIYLAFESGSFQYLTAYYIKQNNHKTVKYCNLIKSVIYQSVPIISTMLFIFVMIEKMKYKVDDMILIMLLILISLVGTSLSLLARSQLAAHKKVSLNSKVTAISITLRYLGLYIISLYTLEIKIHICYLSLIAIIESYLRIIILQSEFGGDDSLECRPKAPLKSTFSVGFGALAVAGDRWCVGFLYSEKELGIYTLAVNITSALMNIVSPLVAYMQPYLIENSSEARNSYFKHLFFIYSVIFGTVLTVASVIFLFRDDLFVGLNKDILSAVIISGIIYLGGVLNSLAEPIYAQWLLFERFYHILCRNFIAFSYLFISTITLYYSGVKSLEVIASFHIINGLCIYFVNYFSNLHRVR